jgi:hypothetical protein
MAALTVMLAAKPHSASRDTRGTAIIPIRNVLRDREWTRRRKVVIFEPRLRQAAAVS